MISSSSCGAIAPDPTDELKTLAHLMADKASVSGPVSAPAVATAPQDVPSPLELTSASPDASQLLQKKKTRKNPTRRRSEQAKVNRLGSTETIIGVNDVPTLPQIDKATVTPTPTPTTTPDAQSPPKQRKRPRKLNVQASGATPSAAQPAPRPPLAQHRSAPASETVTNIRPALVRSQSFLDEKRSSLALVAPALVTGGLVGCVAGAAILSGVCMWHDASGANSAILAAQAAKVCVDNLTEDIITSLKSGTFSTDEALDVLRRSSLAYASTIPRGTAFVERFFREIEMVRKQRGREVDSVLAEACQELSRAKGRGATQDEMQDIAWTKLAKLSTFASNTLRDVVDRNPSLKPYKESLQGHPKPKVPTLKYNLTVRKKQSAAG